MGQPDSTTLEHTQNRDNPLRGHALVAHSVLRNPNLSHGARLTYALLKSYAWQDEQCWPARETLAADLGAHKSTVTEWLQELITARLIERVDRRREGKTNLYVILDAPSTWSPPGDHPSRPQATSPSRPQATLTKKQVDEEAIDEEARDGRPAARANIFTLLGIPKTTSNQTIVAQVISKCPDVDTEEATAEVAMYQQAHPIDDPARRFKHWAWSMRENQRTGKFKRQAKADRPAEFDENGNWTEEYADRHDRIWWERHHPDRPYPHSRPDS